MIFVVRAPRDVDMVAVGRRLRQVREERGLAATRLDAFAGVGRGSVSRIEDAERPELSLLVLARIADYLDVPLDWLVWGETSALSQARPQQGVDVPAAGFLNQVNRLPALLDYLESRPGATVSLLTLARALRAYRDRPPPRDARGVPLVGWGAFLAEADGGPNHPAGKPRARRSAKPR